MPNKPQTTTSLENIIKERERYREALVKIAQMDRTGFGRTALGRVAREALNAKD